MTKSQIDKLGERLRAEPISSSDLESLDAFRRSFAEPFEQVLSIIRGKLHIEPSSRPQKSTPSICNKLRREKGIKLSQIQDIAGCRVLVRNIAEQQAIVSQLASAFQNHRVYDRRAVPSNGYRAVHVVVVYENHRIEIQVRTEMQQIWAQTCEYLADALDPAIKYGGGDAGIKDFLIIAAHKIGSAELAESLTRHVKNFDGFPNVHKLIFDSQLEIDDVQFWLKTVVPPIIKARKNEVGGVE